MKICPKCKNKCYPDKVGNWYINFMGIMESHNIECDNIYLLEEEKK